MSRLVLLAVLPALLLVAACGDAAEEQLPTGDLTSADAVADAMELRYTQNLGPVTAFTVTGGGARALYTLSGDTTGLDRFAPPEVAPASDGVAPSAPAQLLLDQVPNVPRMARGLRTASFSGPVTRDGRRAYVFTTGDPGALFGEPGLPMNDTTTTVEFSVYVDATTFDVIEISQVVSSQDLPRPVSSRTLYSNFQETDGLTLAHTMRRIETGLNMEMEDTERLLMGGNLGIAIEQIKMQPASPERDAKLAELEGQQRLISEGILDMTLDIESVSVGAREE